MTRTRHILTCLIVFGLLAMIAPAASFAAGGGSAGDQQYTDPLAGTHPGGSSTSSATSSTPAPSTPAPSASTPAPATSTSAAPTPTTPVTPTATVAGSGTDPSGTAKALPYTGYESWEVAGFGLVLVAGGLGLRWRAQRQ